MNIFDMDTTDLGGGNTASSPTATSVNTHIEDFNSIDNSSECESSICEMTSEEAEITDYSDSWSTDWTDWQTESTQTSGDWYTEEDQLKDVLRWSPSIIARNLASLSVLLESGQAEELAKFERKIHERITLQSIRSRRNRRLERTIWIDDECKMRQLLDRVVRLDHTRPQVVIDCEGLNFKQTGTIDIMEMFVTPHDTLYLIDVVALKDCAWSTTATNSDFCLRQFLTSNIYKKIMWDLRMDAHILKALYNIRLSGIIDCSLWDVACRQLASPSSPAFRMSVGSVCKIYLKGRVGNSEIQCLEDSKDQRSSLPPRPWAIRPLPSVLLDYTADVKYMGMLYSIFERKLRRYPSTVEEIEFYTEAELEIACDKFCDVSSGGSAASPWSHKYLESARLSIQLNKEDAERQASSARCEPRLQTVFDILSSTVDYIKVMISSWLSH